MNERIKKLAEQAGFLNKDEESIGYFAELIVRECMSIVSKSGNSKAEILNDLEEFIWSTK